ncbi:MAG: inner membrane protein YpjD [Arsenophonus endosymbiont of Dermacentor nuttalli]
MSVFAIIAISTYFLSVILMMPGLAGKQKIYARLTLLLAVIALISHGIALKILIFVSVGQNLTLLNLGSIVSLLISIIMTIVAFNGRAWFLLPIVYSLSIINLLLATIMPSEFITHLGTSIITFIHIGLALLGYAILIIAALYALQLALLDYQLKNKKLTFTPDMPPLMVIERKMFHIIQVGVILLTLTLGTGFIFMDNVFNKENIHKAILSICAWFIYIILLWGHIQRGWRGRIVIIFNLIGVVILTLAFFGNRLLQHVTIT